MDTHMHKQRRRNRKPVLKPYHGDPYKWCVYYVGTNGKRVRSLFRQKNEAAAFLADKAIESENLGTVVASGLDDSLKREAFEAMALLRPRRKTLIEAVKAYCAHLDATQRSETLSTARDQFLLATQKAGKSAVYVTDLRCRLNCFVKTRPDTLCAEITTRELSLWLAGLKVANLTRNHYRRVLSAFFGWCDRLGYCAQNPVGRVDKATETPTTIRIYSPSEMSTILRVAATWPKSHECRDILANVVLCGFAGLRQSEFERLSWEQIKSDRGIIDLSATITKTAARRIVRIQPVLAAWLNHLGSFSRGPIAAKGFDSRKGYFHEWLAAEHKTQWKQNALRHSFASYLMEKVQNPGEVSLQLGHSDAGVVFAHYRELVTTDDTNAYWALTPEKVLKDAEVIDLDGTLEQAS
jgi:integrase